MESYILLRQLQINHRNARSYTSLRRCTGAQLRMCRMLLEGFAVRGEETCGEQRSPHLQAQEVPESLVILDQHSEAQNNALCNTEMQPEFPPLDAV